MRNVWEAGSDALLKALAERDARKRLDEDRARQMQLDEERRAQILAQQELQRGQLKSIDEDRDERRRMAGEAAEAAGTNALLKDETTRRGEAAKQAAVQAYKEAVASGDDKAVQGAIADLAVHGIRVPTPPASGGAGFTLSPGQQRFDATGKQIGSVPDRPRTGPAGPSVPRSERELPQGVTDWLDTLTQFPTIQEARKALNEGWQQQRKHHPEVDLQKAAAYLDKSFPFGQSEDVAGGKMRAAAVVQPGGQPAPAVTPNAVPDTQGNVTPAIQKPIPGIPGGIAEFRNGQWIRIK